MSDTLYLSLWCPNLRLAALPDQRVWRCWRPSAKNGELVYASHRVAGEPGARRPPFAVCGRVRAGAGRAGEASASGIALGRPREEEALELLHERSTRISSRLDGACGSWKLRRTWIRAGCASRGCGVGRVLDEGSYEQDGHIRIFFGMDTPFLEGDGSGRSGRQACGSRNVRQLVELTAAVEKGSGATARLLWSELGETAQNGWLPVLPA